MLAALFLARGKWGSRTGRQGAILAGLSALLAIGGSHVISHFWERARPYEAHPSDAHLLIAPSHDPSFPSDHATAAFAIAAAILLRHRKAGIVALVMAVVLSVGRVAVGTHYPSDVLGGAALGVLAALALWHPLLRLPLHALADSAAALYERVAGAAAGRLRLGT